MSTVATDEKKPPEAVVSGLIDVERLVDGLRVGSPGSKLRLLMKIGEPISPLWSAVRAARGANEPALMLELEDIANRYDALFARVQPAVLFEPK